ncbi:NrfD/PsrC family molybdoenzyme membrane anchor subunit [Sunxiuqinia elliptica]|uniref:Formate-dependent nitrite reductase membrane component NrfD n=1 Tax=Sunxiuqinia elliptica TaxID=655355 RepID=A0A4R6GP33_9BACT|nr:NrfD/PsrC family molybdoenzyme membrane anchor subunit [Sunxiuqinia elliptica]TDN96224.1 formate-dependent nitrite reductase membrane component NrfD [Sunxiuqinia elliptica]TDO67935.1 formate-dependent nitrite reductase membrane component NrfD [Sunxiuqinia elliptica]
MREELITSGRMNPNIDPHLEIWHWHIPLYLFLGGLAAGILFFAALYVILGKESKYAGAVRRAPIIVPFLLVIGLAALFLDLRHKLYFWQLYTTIKLQSPMSWGAWTLMGITPISVIWVAIHIQEYFPKWEWKNVILKDLNAFFLKNKLALAWVTIVLSVILGIYTGILFSAFNARPLWNTSILGPLFLASGLSAGAATIILFARSKEERLLFARIDILLIVIELFLIIHMFMGFKASTQVQIDAVNMFLGGQYTAPFWIFVVVLGMLVPALLEFLELRHKKIPVVLPVALVLFGSLMLRFIIAYAGQMSRWLY